MIDAVAIDGPAGSGKSTIARSIAARLGFLYVDTGAMYRAVALGAVRKGVDLNDPDAVGVVAESCALSFDASGAKVLLDGEDVSTAIRTPEATANTKYAARSPRVRARLVALQREMAQSRPVVMEGRDITTVVLPEARWRFFVTATPEVRAKRRQADFQAKGHAVDLQTLIQEIRERDASDDTVGPMKEARALAESPDEAITLIDTSDMSPAQVIDAIVSHVEKGA